MDLENIITLVFSEFNLIFHLAHHIANFIRSCCKSFDVICMFRLKVHCAVSSANWDREFCLWYGVGRSVDVDQESNGLRTEPCALALIWIWIGSLDFFHTPCVCNLSPYQLFTNGPESNSMQWHPWPCERDLLRCIKLSKFTSA